MFNEIPEDIVNMLKAQGLNGHVARVRFASLLEYLREAARYQSTFAVRLAYADIHNKLVCLLRMGNAEAEALTLISVKELEDGHGSTTLQGQPAPK